MKVPLVMVLLLPACALAGRPLSTEDASTLDEKACQVESWVDRTRSDATALVLAPACSVFGVEWEAGGTWVREGGRSATATTWVQGKVAFRSVDEGAWGVGVVAGVARFPQREEKNGWGDPYVIVPVSIGLGADKETRALLHLNIGTTRIRDEARNRTLWGVALEKPVTESLVLLAEAFGENSRNPFFRAGGRYALFEGFDVDLTAVTRSGGTREDRLWSLGFHWEWASVLP
jgi:hypothetical protein